MTLGENKQYLGDGVYVAVDSMGLEAGRGMLVLTAENGIEAHDTIYLEPDVAASLARYITSTLVAAGKEQP